MIIPLTCSRQLPQVAVLSTGLCSPPRAWGLPWWGGPSCGLPLTLSELPGTLCPARHTWLHPLLHGTHCSGVLQQNWRISEATCYDKLMPFYGRSQAHSQISCNEKWQEFSLIPRLCEWVAWEWGCACLQRNMQFLFMPLHHFQVLPNTFLPSLAACCLLLQPNTNLLGHWDAVQSVGRASSAHPSWHALTLPLPHPPARLSGPINSGEEGGATGAAVQEV